MKISFLLVSFIVLGFFLTSNPHSVYSQSEDGDESSIIERMVSPVRSGLNITSSTIYFEGDYFHIVGEVLNTASTEKDFVKVIATLYDDKNKVIGTDFTYTNPSTIFPQETSPFSFMIGQSDVSNLGAIKSYKIMASDEYFNLSMS